MCGTEVWEKYVDIKEGSGLKLIEDSPKLCVDRGFRDRLSYEGDGTPRKECYMHPEQREVGRKEKWGRTLS